MPTLYPYRLFVSHAWRYSEGYNRLIGLLNNAANFDYRNYSVPESRAFDGLNNSQLKSQLTLQINPTQCVIILAGMYVNYSDWIQYEINEANRLGKPIIGVIPWGAERTPAAVSSAAREMVSWQTSSIVAAVRRAVP